MNRFDTTANNILKKIMEETSQQSIKIKLPSGDIVDVMCVCGDDSCIAAETVDSIQAGDDVTEFVVPEEDSEDIGDEQLKKLGLAPKDVASVSTAVKLAQGMSTKAQGSLFQNPQKKMNQAYGTLMNKLASKISTMAAKIQ